MTRTGWYKLSHEQKRRHYQAQQHADAVKGMGATALYLFGSTVRDEALASSDLDLFIDYDPAKCFSLGIQRALEIISEATRHISDELLIAELCSRCHKIAINAKCYLELTLSSLRVA